MNTTIVRNPAVNRGYDKSPKLSVKDAADRLSLNHTSAVAYVKKHCSLVPEQSLFNNGNKYSVRRYKAAEIIAALTKGRDDGLIRPLIAAPALTLPLRASELRK